MAKEYTSFQYTRQWFDFCFEHQGEVNTNDTALYLWLVELKNRMGWVENFGCPASQCMAAMGVGSYNTYKKSFDKLVQLGFVKVIKPSVNQYQANIIALSIIDKPKLNALDKSLTMHMQKQSESTVETTCDIDKPINQQTNKQINKVDIPPLIFTFEGEANNESLPNKPPTPPLPVKPQKKPKPISCLFEESEYFDLQKFEAEFVGSKYEGYNLEFYYEKVLNWSRSGGQKKVDWIATARNFMLGDYEKGKAVLKPQNILYGQQQSNTNRHTGGKPSLDNIRNELASKYGQNGGQG